MKTSILTTCILFCAIVNSSLAQSFDLCNDLLKTTAMGDDPHSFKKGEGTDDDLWVYYDCAIFFKGATQARAHYWSTGKLSNVIQTFGENLPEQKALETFDALANEFRTCYSALKEEESSIGLRKDLSFQIHKNLVARLAMYYSNETESGETGYTVFFDIYYTGD